MREYSPGKEDRHPPAVGEDSPRAKYNIFRWEKTNWKPGCRRIYHTHTVSEPIEAKTYDDMFPKYLIK